MDIVPDLINGIDLCSLQDQPVSIDAMAIRKAGFRFAYIKSSQYSSTKDARFSSLVDRLRGAGLIVGAYHFCAHNSDPADQAEFFYRASKGLGTQPGDLPPVADFEFCTPGLYKTSAKGHPQHCVDWIETFLKTCTELWYPDNARRLVSRLPVVYSYPIYCRGHQPSLGESSLGRYPFFYASYTPGVELSPAFIPAHAVPKPWDKALLCQHKGNDGRVPGIVGACDMDVFLGSSGEWAEFIGLERPVDSIELDPTAKTDQTKRSKL